ncbi:LysE family transporter, partial [Curtobacterium sp. A7_M15]|uniref:LysE family transporter n=1 Tax=Curtobacterium sp. A7_M15 TaxID=3065241 RepID=UPI002737C114
MTALLPLLAGLGTGLALIVAIGVQNAYLLRIAVTSSVRVVAAAVVVCALSDAVLILAGVLGVGVVVERFPVALVVIRFVGAAFLVTYGVLAARRALRPTGAAMRVESEAAEDGVAGAARGVPAAGHAPADAGVAATTAPADGHR